MMAGFLLGAAGLVSTSHRAFGLAFGGFIETLSAPTMLAQFVLAQQGGTVRSEGGGKGYVFEGILVVIGLGLALFAACRSSRRA